MTDATTRQDLLIELGCEELPPRALDALAQAFAAGLLSSLEDAFARDPAMNSQVFATPRRLAARISSVPDRQADQRIDRLGPAVAAAFDDAGNPTKAATGFARSCGVAVEALQRRDTDKGERLAHTGTEAGKTLAQLLPEILATTLKTLPIPKRMRWGASDATFVRPVHWLLALHGADVVPLEVFGCTAGRTTYGHRFHYPQALELVDAGNYEHKLRDPGHVIVSLSERRDTIRTQVEQAAAAGGGHALLDAALLDEVAALVEWPLALAGTFDPGFLELPREALIATLEDHQRYFPVEDDAGRLQPRFVTVANIDSRQPRRVIAGNERVVRPRLADALFFYHNDQQHGLAAFAGELDKVTFQRGLGSLADKTARLESLGDHLASLLDCPRDDVRRAATLAKADLLTDMVGEFPQLQGIMGGYYATQESAAVGAAISEHYAPRFATDSIPISDVGRILSLADRLDTLAGIFALGKRPSGEKDPFALRRAALGVLRILIEGQLPLDLRTAIYHAIALQPVSVDAEELTQALLAFLLERLRGHYLERGFRPELFEAVAVHGIEQPLDFEQRMLALRAFVDDPAAVNLAAAHKRVRNILKNQTVAQTVDPDVFSLPAEHTLHTALQTATDALDDHFDRSDYQGALHTLAVLQAPVDTFFDTVRVMSDDADERGNRLALLARLDRACRQVADISRLSIE